jgi:protein SCO1
MARMNNTSGMKPLRTILWIAVALAAAIALILFSNTKPKMNDDEANAAALSKYVGGPFTLTNGATGKPFTEKDLVGKPSVMFFGFTRCPDVCPTALQRMARLRKAMNADDSGSGDAFDIIFVSVDAESDSPQGVVEYVKLFATPIIPLGGTQAQIDAIAKAYKIYVNRVPTDNGGYTIDHSASLFLLDKQGKVVGTIDHKEQEPVALDKLKLLINR